jgi:hypothetical protein
VFNGILDLHIHNTDACCVSRRTLQLLVHNLAVGTNQAHVP